MHDVHEEANMYKHYSGDVASPLRESHDRFPQCGLHIDMHEKQRASRAIATSREVGQP